MVVVKRFPENTYFPEMLISGKGKCFHVFGCISKNFPENIFWCLEKKKENTNPEKHKPQPRSSPKTNPVRRPRRRSRSEIAIDGVISRSVDREIAYVGERGRSEIAIDASWDRAIDRDLAKKARSRSPIAITTRSSLMILYIFCVVACVFWFVFSFFFSKHQTPENIFRKIF